MSTISETIIRDGFFVEFNDREEFMSFIGDFDKDTRWESIPASSVTYIPLSSITPGELTAGGNVGYSDSEISGLPIAVKLDDGRIFGIRPYLYKNIKQHHRDNAAVLSDMLTAGNVAAFCDHLNASKPFLKKNIMMLTRGAKISGWFSEFNANWSQSAQFSFVENAMRANFPQWSFMRGEVSHLYTSGTYALEKSISSPGFTSMIGEKVMGPYLDAWESAGGRREDLLNAVPQCKFMTGESGLTSIVLTPIVRMPDGMTFFLGSSLSVNHRGDDEKVWKKFETFPEQIAVLYQKGMKALAKLCSRGVAHPYNCMTHCLMPFRSSIPAEYLKDLCSTMEMFYPQEDNSIICMAIEIYNSINEMVHRAGATQAPLKRLQNMELLARLMVSNWDDFDKATPAKLFGKGESSAAEVSWLSM